MPRDGSGNYTLPVNSWSPAVNGAPATAADWQSLINDVASAVSASVAKDGQTAMTGDLSLGGNKITNLDPGTASTDAVNKNQLNTLDSTGISAYMKTVLDDADASTAQTTLGGTTVGKALFTAADEAAAQTAIGLPAGTAGKVVLAAETVSTARSALELVSGTWTPTITAVTNITSKTARVCQYQRVGNIVNFSGSFEIVATTTTLGQLCSVTVSLPVASNFTSTENTKGVVVTNVLTTYGIGDLSANISSDTLNLDGRVLIGGQANLEFRFSGHYVIM